MAKDQTRLGTSPGGMYGNRNYGATQRDLGAAMGMVAGGPGKLPPEGVASLAGMFADEMSSPAVKPTGPKPFKSGNKSTLTATGYSDLEAAFNALEGKDLGVKLATMQPGSAMGGTAGGPALSAFTDYGVQDAADKRMLAAGNIYADNATASIAPTAAQAAVTEAMAYAPRKSRMRMTIPGKLVAQNAGSSLSGPSKSSDGGGGSAWGVSGSRPTGGGAGGERTGARSFYGR